MHTFKKAIVITSIAALAGCGGGGNSPTSPAPTSTKGQLSLQLTDAPVDALQEVVITVTGVSIKPAVGEAQTITFSSPKIINMLDLQNGATESLLDKTEVSAGNYEWVRLELSPDDGALYVKDELGGIVGLKVPSGFQTGLKLNTGFVVPQGGASSFTIDFDLRKSVTKPNGQTDYFLKPSLRLIDNTSVGTLSGTVAGTLLQSACTNAGEFAGLVYVFSGANVVPDDYDGTEPEAIASGRINYSAESGYAFKIPFLSAGDYSIAYTCELDDSAADEALNFHQIQNISISKDTATTVNFN
jgi:hypothetical protein